MTMTKNNGANLLATVTGIALMTVFSIFALHAENETSLLILLAVGAAGVFGAYKSGFVARAGQGLQAHRHVGDLCIVSAFAAMVLVFRNDHFALLQLATVLLYCVVCIGLNLQIGYCGVMNFAGAAFFGVGAYTAAVLSTHTQLPHLLVLLAGGFAAALIGSVLLLPVLRTRGHYAALVTIAFGTLFRSFLEVNDTLGGPQGLKVPGMQILGWTLSDEITVFGMSFSFYVNYVILAFALLAGVFILTRRIKRSWLGLSLDAVRIDETAASTFGIHIVRWKITAFIIGNLFAGIAGAFFAMMTSFVAPANFTFGDSLILLSIIVLGGIGNLWGILPAAAIVLLLPEKLQAIQEYRFLLYAGAVILILLFRPQGMFPRRLRTLIPGLGSLK
ncbi:MAG: branched-chain amino acid ABC transporter permease [Polaromonas sp.]|uniref:branched-chain amino acid ABC transporter permease n=1 Tax=Polaromonas sp. TaxID=1869339 RepID=UPI002734093F|nr:branched-chain amino acid ABC transporter permease [Polaromonas sp.]MDP3798933.1 branched-chain amino acid ABC transporter permease [Polaromonas sp.]